MLRIAGNCASIILFFRIRRERRIGRTTPQGAHAPLGVAVVASGARRAWARPRLARYAGAGRPRSENRRGNYPARNALKTISSRKESSARSARARNCRDRPRRSRNDRAARLSPRLAPSSRASPELSPLRQLAPFTPQIVGNRLRPPSG
jgi:hypothetical protein